MTPNETAGADALWIEPRSRMVEEQLRKRWIRDPRVLAAMAAVPRHAFVPPSLRRYAYDDAPLAIGHGQTISQPYTVAFMCEALALRGDEKVLEVGTGCGYGAAVLSRLAHSVFTIERVADLARSARQRLQSLGVDNVVVVEGDGTAGLSSDAPFDAVVVTAAARGVPRPLLDQLRDDGGRLVMPVGKPGESQSMVRLRKHGDRLEVDHLGDFCFVPLVGRFGELEDRGDENCVDATAT